MQHRLPAAFACGAVAVLSLPSAAAARVTPTTNPFTLARSMAASPDSIVSARWVKRPPRAGFAAVSTTPKVGFPRSGRAYSVLSSGAARLVGRGAQAGNTSFSNRGLSFRGTRDTVILRADIAAPSNARCLSFSFRFLSEEFPEFVDSRFNDAFIAELGRSNWRSPAGSANIRAPRNFAFGREKRRITVNGTGDFNVTRDRARGTVYDAGTRRLRASTPIAGGRTYSVFFSIFDQGDRQYDSSVVLDGLATNRRRPCTSGAALD